jgi:hypothetical protein
VSGWWLLLIAVVALAIVIGEKREAHEPRPPSWRRKQRRELADIRRAQARSKGNRDHASQKEQSR